MISGEQELITNSWRQAIDKWAIERSVGNTGYIIGTYMGKEKLFEDHQDISEWSKFLLDNNYNRIEKRLMTEAAFEQEYDGMEVVDVKDDIRFRDQIPDLMGKVFGGSEKLKERSEEISKSLASKVEVKDIKSVEKSIDKEAEEKEIEKSLSVPKKASVEKSKPTKEKIPPKKRYNHIATYSDSNF